MKDQFYQYIIATSLAFSACFAAENSQVADIKEKLESGLKSLVLNEKNRGFPKSEIQKGEIASLLIGINYQSSPHSLSNCILDINHVLSIFLKPYLGAKQENVIYMSDEMVGTAFYPTKNNILMQLRKFSQLLSKSKVGYLHYSGHGTRVKDTSGDEEDGYDEAMVPIDYASSGMILDDDLYGSFIKSLPSDVTLLVVADCCHSGTIFDLPFLWDEGGRVFKPHKVSKIETDQLPFVIALSGCKDTQTSADGGPLRVNREGSGALTAAYLQVLKDYKYDLTYRELLMGVNQLLKKYGFDQRPQLSSTKPIDLDSKYLIPSSELVLAH